MLICSATDKTGVRVVVGLASLYPLLSTLTATWSYRHLARGKSLENNIHATRISIFNCDRYFHACNSARIGSDGVYCRESHSICVVHPYILSSSSRLLAAPCTILVSPMGRLQDVY